MVFDNTTPQCFVEKQVVKCDWSEFYPNATEATPESMLTPLGKGVAMSCFVNTDHTGCRETSWLHSGNLILVNRAPIRRFSKGQKTVEASTYGSELLEMRLLIYIIEGL